MRLNRASLRREPETAGRYSFNHPKVGSDSFVRCMAQVFRQSRRDSVPGHSESVATGDQKTDGKIDPSIERRCLKKNFYNTKILGAYGTRTRKVEPFTRSFFAVSRYIGIRKDNTIVIIRPTHPICGASHTTPRCFALVHSETGEDL